MAIGRAARRRGQRDRLWKASHEATGVVAAVKKIQARKPQSERYRRFIAEISTLRALGAFPGVLSIIDNHLPESVDEQPWMAPGISRQGSETIITR